MKPPTSQNVRKVFFLVLLICFSAEPIYSQTPVQEDLHLRYWQQRQKFWRYFVRIGTSQGASLPIASRDPDVGNYGIPANSFCGPNPTGIIKFGDEPQLLGYYIAMLATEYRLTVLDGGDPNPILNELYYAIQAVNRLDNNAEQYLSNTALPQNQNGFICRDDVLSSYPAYFTQQASATSDFRDSRDACVDGDGYNIEFPGPNHSTFNGGNEMSQDHIFNLFFGFAFVKKYVDNVFIKPRASVQGFYLVNEVQAITSRIMNNIAPARTFNEDVNCINLITGSQYNGDLEVTATWRITNPVTARAVQSESELHFLVYPLAQAAKYITGIDYADANHYPDVSWNYTLPSLPNYAQHCLSDPAEARSPYSFQANFEGQIFWSNLQYAFQPSYDLGDICIPLTNACFHLGYTPPPAAWEVNGYLFSLLATTGGSWEHQSVVNVTNDYNMGKGFDLAFAALHNQTPIRGQGYYENYLSLLPCNGPFNHDEFIAGPNDQTYPWNTTNVWSGYLPINATNEGAKGEYSGLDWMLMYNLYRLAFQQPANDYLNSVSCGCNSHIRIESNRTGLYLNTNVALYRKNTDILDLGIAVEEYLTEPLILTNTSWLTVNTDLVVCGVGSSLNISSGGLVIGNAAGDPCKVIVRKGASLQINDASSLIIHDNSELIIEEGAILYYNNMANSSANPTIQLSGSNSRIVIKGQMTIGGDFTFIHSQTNTGYIKFARSGYVTYDINDNNYQLLIQPNATVHLEGTGPQDKVLEIDQQALWIPDQLSLLKIHNATVEFTGGALSPADAPLMSIGPPNTDFYNVKFYTPAGNTPGRGIYTYGQSTHSIVNCTFQDMQAGIVAANTWYGAPFAAQGCQFTNCGYGIASLDRTVVLNGCTFNQCGEGVYAVGLNESGTIQNCTFANCTDGIYLDGGPVEMLVDQCQIQYCNAGIQTFGATASVKCSDVSHNVIGFQVNADGILRMNSTLNSGYTIAQQNQMPISCDQAGAVDVNQGYNDLRIETDPTCTNNFCNPPAIITGTINDCSLATLNARQNQWDAQLQNYTFRWPQPTGPWVTDLHYNFNDLYTVCGTEIRVSDPSQQFWSQCVGGSGGGNRMALGNCIDCNQRSTETMGNVYTDDATLSAINDLSANQFETAAFQLGDLLLSPGADTSASDEYMLVLADRKMHEAFSLGLKYHQIDTSVTDTVFAQVLDAEDNNKQFALQNNEMHTAFYAGMRRAQALRAAGRYQEALAEFQQLTALSQPGIQFEHLAFWQCITQAEYMLKSGQTSKEAYFGSVMNCLPADQANYQARMINQELATSSSAASTLQLTPNPVNEILTISLANSNIASATLEIIDLSGRTIRTMPLNGLTSVQIDITELPEGIYLCRVNSSHPQTQRFVVTHQ